MRRSLALGLVVLACRSGIKTPETIPLAPGVLDSIPPAIAPPAVDTSARAAVQGGTPSRALIAADWSLGQRVTPVTGEHAMVVTSHPLASNVGVDMLRRGGNAIDAAVAVASALAVVHPVAGNIGGGGFLVARMQEGTVGALDFRETAPTRATRDMYVDTAGNAIGSSLTGHRSVGVPGTVAGMYEAHRRFGRLPWKELLVPAIALARDGYLLDGPRSHVIEREAERLGRFPASRAQFLVDGAAPPPGTRFVQPELARTLQLIADSGAAAFYDGSIAHLIVREMARGGGLITRQDLAHYVAKWRDPIVIRYRGYTIYTMPPPSGGGVTLAEILNAMEGDAPVPPFGSAELMHLQSEAGRPNLFGLVQGEANAIAPGKRMLSAMTPSIVVDSAGRLVLVLGSPGGSRIPTAVYQVISDVVDQGMSLAEAVAAPRLHHQAQPDVVYLERDGFEQTAIDSLQAMGHKVDTWAYKTEVNAIARAAAGWVGVADPRRGGGAAGD